MHDHRNVSARSGVPSHFALRAALLFCAPMMVNGIGLPYFPVFLEYLGLTGAEIGIILAMPHLVRIVGTPLGAAIADRANDRSIVLIWSAAISLVTAVILHFTHSFWAVLFVYSLQGIFYAPFAPIAEAIMITGVRRWGFDYGFLRLWGSVAFIGATFAGGWLLQWFGGAMVPPAMATFFILTVIMSFAAPKLGRPVQPSPEASAKSPVGNPFWRPDFLLVVIGAALTQGSHAMLFGFASIYWTGLGFGGGEIGALWTTGVLAEIVMFVFASRLMGRFSVWTLILTGSLITVLRWVLFPLSTGIAVHFALQATHAFTFGIIHIGVQKFLMQRVAERQESSAQGIYTTFIALFNAVLSFASGYIFQSYGVEGFHFMVIVAAVGIVSILIALFLQPQSARSGGKTIEPS
ncbi:MFS transporter [Rhizobium alvei]|uniref:MFS transporter n=1 Tax=Rhizobium alvei TaxID=1132659 RepID=A0ABT8YJQ8_9HYPH|nr:MFS transporter [Rhizobium alvei]MDO6963934.1 MFS transporter [Rhizobium alvei]